MEFSPFASHQGGSGPWGLRLMGKEPRKRWGWVTRDQTQVYWLPAPGSAGHLRRVQCLEEIMFEWSFIFNNSCASVSTEFLFDALKWGPEEEAEQWEKEKKKTIKLLFGNFIFPFYSGNCLAELKHCLLFFVFHKFGMRQEKLASSVIWGHAIMVEK